MSDAGDEAIFDQAAMWCGRIRAGEMYDYKAFEAWMAADVRHREAYDEALAAWDMFNADPAASKLLAMRAEALADAHRASARQTRTRFNLDRRTLVAGVAAAVVLPAIGLFTFNHAEAHEFLTGTGELRNIDLPDGSTMSLDANSHARVSFSMARRYVELVKGRAKFTVAKHQTRVFQVSAGKKVVTATGTAFTAEYRHQVLDVVLLEGSVRVDGAGKRRNLTSHQALSWARDGEPVVVEAVDLNKATSWQNGELFFENATLLDVVERLNDYSTTKLKVADARTGQLRISGMFMVGQTAQFVDAVKSYYSVEVATGDATVTLKAKGKL